MPVSRAQLESNKRYAKAKLDDVRFRVPKGEREVIKAHAQKMG